MVVAFANSGPRQPGRTEMEIWPWTPPGFPRTAAGSRNRTPDHGHRRGRSMPFRKPSPAIRTPRQTSGRVGADPPSNRRLSGAGKRARRPRIATAGTKASWPSSKKNSPTTRKLARAQRSQRYVQHYKPAVSDMNSQRRPLRCALVESSRMTTGTSLSRFLFSVGACFLQMIALPRHPLLRLTNVT